MTELENKEPSTPADPSGAAVEPPPAPADPAPSTPPAHAEKKHPHPRPPRPSPVPRRDGPNVAGLTLRVAVLATAVSCILIFIQMNKIGTTVGTGADAGGSAGASVAGTTPEGATAVAAAGAAGTPAPGPDAAAPPALPATPPPDDARLVRFHGLLDGVTDYEDVAQNRAYAALAEHVRRLTDDEAARILRKDLDLQALLKYPASYRGEIVEVTGYLAELQAIRLAPGAGPPGVEDAWRGWLLDLGEDGAYVFDFVGLPIEVSTRDVVRVEGAFLKVIRFENKAGKPRDAVFLIARRAWRLDEDEMPRGFRYDYMAVLLIAVMGIGVVVQRKRAADEKSLLEARRGEIERRQQRKTPKGTEPPRSA